MLPVPLYLLLIPSVAAQPAPAETALFQSLLFQVQALGIYCIWLFSERGCLLHISPQSRVPSENCSRQETAAAPGQGTAWGKSGFFSKNTPSEEFVPERWRMEIPMGSAPACLTDSPQHPSGWYSGCYNEFLGLTICWDNDFRCTGHSYAPALLQHLLLPC